MVTEKLQTCAISPGNAAGIRVHHQNYLWISNDLAQPVTDPDPECKKSGLGLVPGVKESEKPERELFSI